MTGVTTDTAISQKQQTASDLTQGEGTFGLNRNELVEDRGMGEERINCSLKEHQESVSVWPEKDRVQALHIWMERFTSKLSLDVGVPALTVDRFRSTCYGHFRPARNGFGLIGEIGMNTLYMTEPLSWRNLATLLHELGHAHQARTGEPGAGNYHNKAFRDWAKTVGFIVDKAGHTRVLPPPSPFWNVLGKWGVSAPDGIALETAETPRWGQSKLKLWICACQPDPVRVRVAVPDFQARCLKCGQIFRLKQR
jgi:hypothetical protein